MEKAISIEDRVRRAEEIYKRKKQDVGTVLNVRTSSINRKEKVKITLFKRMILQILICIVIYFILYVIKNSNYFFSENVIEKTKNFLSYDINLNSIYNSVISYYEDNIKPLIEDNKEDIGDNKEEKIENIEEVKENSKNVNVNTTEEVSSVSQNNEISENKEENTKETSADVEEKVELSQMEIDAKEIKEKYSLMLPLVGTITSRYGPRTPTQIVSANHAGIDIGVNEGTVFVAAMEGKVTTASSYGSYGNHIFIENGDVMTVYAHCKKLYVKEGDIIEKGQKLGEVGQTGNATGPHLHFEIRKNGRTVNPEYVLNFG